MARKDELLVLLERFGSCGCKERRETQQYGDAGAGRKPGGRFSVCEIEADQHGLDIPKKDDANDP